MRLKYLRVNPKKAGGRSAAAPCTEELNALLTCWRHSGVDSTSCLNMVHALNLCSSRQVLHEFHSFSKVNTNVTECHC